MLAAGPDEDPLAFCAKIAPVDAGDGGYNGDPDRLGERSAGDAFAAAGRLQRIPAPASHTHRHYRHPQVARFRVITFVLGDEDFPRSISCCVDRARRSAEKLPRGEATQLALDAVSELFEYTTAGMLSGADVRKLMDDIQLRLGDAHQAVVATWFLPDDES
jgi:uncharacterized alpha-E superfamily protein